MALRKRLKRLLPLVVGLVMVATIVPGCPPPVDVVPIPRVMDIGFAWEPLNLQPEVEGFDLMFYGIAETLWKVCFEEQLGPGLATSWEQVDDLTWRFNLRTGVKFHNDQPFNAEAAQFALNSAFAIEGADLEGATVEVEDEYSILIHLVEPTVIVPALLADWATVILARESFDDEGKVITPLGTGPFKFVEWVEGERIVLERFADYWGGIPRVEKAIFHFIPDAHTRATMLRTGELDIARYIPAVEALAMKEIPGIRLLFAATGRKRVVYLNNARPPFDDVRVRRAMNHAINREALIEFVLEGFGTVAYGPFRPGLAWVPDLEGFAYDPDKAKALLKQAGYGYGDLSFTIYTYPGRPKLPILAVAIQDQLRGIGVNVDIGVMKWHAMEERVMAGDFDASIVSRHPTYRIFDPLRFFISDYTTYGGFNMSHYSNLIVDELVKQAVGEKDQDARHKLLQQIQKVLVDEDVVGVWLNYKVVIDGHRQDVVGYRIHPGGTFVLTKDVGFQE